PVKATDILMVTVSRAGSQVYAHQFTGTSVGAANTLQLPTSTLQADQVNVTVNNALLDASAYTVDYADERIYFSKLIVGHPEATIKVSATRVSNGVATVVYAETFTQSYTTVLQLEDGMQVGDRVSIKVNGVAVAADKFLVDLKGQAIIFANAIPANAVVALAFERNLSGFQVKILSGPGAGQSRYILSNSGATLSLTQPWTIAPGV